MVNLKHEVQKRGFTVAHIKTDSIKIPDATPEIIQFVMEYGKMYGYIFEYEATYDRMTVISAKSSQECVSSELRRSFAIRRYSFSDSELMTVCAW